MDGTQIVIEKGLLGTRQSIARRNLIVSGSGFIVCLLAFFAMGMLGALGERETLLISIILVALAFSSISMLVRYEVAKALADFAAMLSRCSGAR